MNKFLRLKSFLYHYGNAYKKHYSFTPNTLSTMNIRSLVFFVFLGISPFLLHAQITGFSDDFSNGTLDTLWNGQAKTLWSTNSNNTFSLSEAEGVLNIAYNRNSESGSNDYVRFSAPEGIDVSENPRFSFFIRSTTTTTLSLKAVFGAIGGASFDYEVAIPGNNEWKEVALAFDPEVFGSLKMHYLFFYFDKGSSSFRFGDIQLDDLKIAGFTIRVQNLEAVVEEGTNVRLNWAGSDPNATKLFRVFRDSVPGFTHSEQNLLSTTTDTGFLDQDLPPYRTFFYKVTAIDTLDEEFIPSAEVTAQTFENGVLPVVSVTGGHATEVPLYTPLKLELALEHTSIFNPYDPDDIDVYARFTSPSGETIRINAFYDNYQEADQWRLYFSPFEIGNWNYKLFINDVNGTDSTETATFEAVESDHHGPIKVSESNPNYMIYHDGTPFYGLAVYYPWNITESKIEELKNHNLNIIGYWNSTYDGAGNGGGRYLFESTSSGLGYYDQRKMGRIEEILGWLEERDMLLMYAIWAHPFLRDGAPGWDPIHYEYNPYKEIVSASEFYTDSLAWEYQLKNYRYLVARFAHHRSLGIWEIINEMHGTTGYVTDQGGALEWIDKVHDYLKEHDPYRRPTTASFGSVELWAQRDVKADIANRHYYETQGYPRPFGDNVHDGLYNVAEAFRGLKLSGTRPAMFGEAGYTSMFSTAGSDEYTQEFHNAFWAGLAIGMASTPFWWDYTTSSIFTDDVMETYLNIGKFVDTLPLSTTSFERQEQLRDDAYIYTLQNDTMAFGWGWRIDSEFISGVPLNINNLNTGSYQLAWFNTWSGEFEQINSVTSVASTLSATVFDMPVPERDIAFRITPIENGDTPYKINFIVPEEGFVAAKTPIEYKLPVYLTDRSGSASRSFC